MENKIKDIDLKNVNGGGSNDANTRELLNLLIQIYGRMVEGRPNASEEEKKEMKEKALEELKTKRPDVDDSEVGAIWIGQ